MGGNIYQTSKKNKKKSGGKGKSERVGARRGCVGEEGVCVYIGSPELLAWSKSKVLWVNVRCYSNEELWN